MREIGWKRALRNAAFALAVLALGGFAVISVAQRRWQWQETFRARAAFPTIGGVEAGAKVLVQGIGAGVVEAVQPPTVPGRPVVLVLRLDERLRHLVRADATARIAAQGVVGAKVVEIVPGRPEAPPLPENGVLAAEAPIELADVLVRARQSLDTLDTVALAARDGLGEINAIASTIRNGEGTLGRLVHDEEAYDRMIALSKRGERTLADLEDNLTAIKGTWPISSYFKTRGFTDADRLLYQPNARRESRTLSADDLFEPGQAVLTAAGRRRLDDIAKWFQSQKRPESTRVVVAAFTDRAPSGSEDLAQILTQDQADAIRSYLVNQHRIDRLPWYRFSQRAIASVGYGTQTPIAGTATAATPRPGRRVEVILFTPQET